MRPMWGVRCGVLAAEAFTRFCLASACPIARGGAFVRKGRGGRRPAAYSTTITCPDTSALIR